ncbi:LysR family transcriptional regulator [Corticibacter populi]|uniref:LysR family transcriptional regulator n=1 Tax=Corticibacter populi TaxID=1550736 RepID=A0A3M6QMK1_9BURK|nr:LysR substrate-binding domain-containing protein [Corticibacter populi]RMX04284.1 LysR family transcriptional regulator [Corticibacter populi]RZS33331.1 DNA-binding transcriptional LysR family regulator [Corticibacter populi]
MELRHLRYFIALAEELHFGRAAQRLAISQPPLSVAIRQLEEDMGARLFERNSKEVRLTAAGEHLLPRAHQLLADTKEIAAEVRGVAQGQGGHLRVGFVASSIYRGLPQALQQFQRQHPQVRLDITELNTSEQVTAISAGRLDFGLVHGSHLPGNLHSSLLVKEPFLCCLPAGHPLARQDPIDLRSLEGERLILFSRSASPLYHEQVLGLLRSAGVEPEHLHEVRHWLTVVALVSRGLGVALVPYAMRRTRLPGTVFLPLAGRHPPSATLAIWRKGPANPLIEVLLDAIRSALQQLEAPAQELPLADQD